jgi:hypothetical protein
MMLLAAIFLGSFIAMKILHAISENTAPAGYTSGSGEPAGIVPPAPAEPPREGSASGADDARLVALRQALDAQGYTDVKFRMQGSTIILWGTVPSDFDRAMVQMLCTTAGVYSLRDHLRIDNTDMGG